MKSISSISDSWDFNLSVVECYIVWRIWKSKQTIDLACSYRFQLFVKFTVSLFHTYLVSSLSISQQLFFLAGSYALKEAKDISYVLLDLQSLVKSYSNISLIVTTLTLWALACRLLHNKTEQLLCLPIHVSVERDYCLDRVVFHVNSYLDHKNEKSWFK